MTGAERRAAILAHLQRATAPVSGTTLGELFQVSRQIIVQDIALLRSQGADIVSTTKGYVVEQPDVCRLIKVRHTAEQTEEELNAIVDMGGAVLDTIVNHRTYGVMEAPLNIKCRADVKHFLDDLAAGISSPLLNLTDGYHFHHVTADTEADLDAIQQKLNELGFLAQFTPYEQEHFVTK